MVASRRRTTSRAATAARGGFRYTKQVAAGDTAVLEFETSVHGKYVNGVDIIRCNDAGRIVEFRVMIRPLQAVNIVHEQMKTMLESIQNGVTYKHRPGPPGCVCKSGQPCSRCMKQRAVTRGCCALPTRGTTG